jgi:hypothetical protein
MIFTKCESIIILKSLLFIMSQSQRQRASTDRTLTDLLRNLATEETYVSISIVHAKNAGGGEQTATFEPSRV